MAIHRLPDYVINRLKAWEVVQRPASMLKELVENSLDAWATAIKITINDGGKSLLSVEDNGSGIELSDMDLLLERYATSKISSEKDLMSLESYGFRWEALASIAEVSKITILTKTAYAEIGTKLQRRGQETVVRHLPVPFSHGTMVSVEDLFYNVPARLKFLKSAQTEFYYCYAYFLDVAIVHFDKDFVLMKNNNLVFDLKANESVEGRILDLFRKDWREKLLSLNFEQEHIKISGVVSDASLRFGSAENIKIYVNNRPVEDKIIKKAIMDSYARQITPWEYPLVVLFVQVPADEVDVNVHPSKLQVKFMDSQYVFKSVVAAISQVLWVNKIASVGNEFFATQMKSQSSENGQETYRYLQSNSESQNANLKSDFSSFLNAGSGMGGSLLSMQRGKMSGEVKDFANIVDDLSANLENLDPQNTRSETLFAPRRSGEISQRGTLDQQMQGETYFHEDIGEYQILGQMRNMYIALMVDGALYLIDQHALAERIAFEKMKLNQDLTSETLLQPLKFEVTRIPNLEEKLEQLWSLGFDIGQISESAIVVYAMPRVFVQYPVELAKLLNYVRYLEEVSFDHIMDGVFATKACKTSIKAGHKLSYLQMKQLLEDGFRHIPGMFVCQHGRPFFVKMDKKNIDGLFDR